MSDVERIPKLIDLIEKFWLHYPALSFNKLIYLLQWEYSHQRNKIGKVVESSEEGIETIGFNLSTIKDDAFLDFLKSKCDSL